MGASEQPDLPLFNQAATAETRRQARGRITPFAHDQRGAVLAFVRGQGRRGAIDQEITEATGICPDSARARRVELAQAGEVVDCGRRRATRSGRPAIVWATPEHATGPAEAADHPATRSAARTSRPAVEPAAEVAAADGLEFRPGETLLAARLRWRREGRCYWCGHRDWLVCEDGRRVCRRCHPPAGELA